MSGRRVIFGRFGSRLTKAHFVIKCAEIMQGGEVFVPKIPSMRLGDQADALANGCQRRSLASDRAKRSTKFSRRLTKPGTGSITPNMYVIHPDGPWFEVDLEQFKTLLQ